MFNLRILITIFFIISDLCSKERVDSIYLTYGQDACHSMVVSWLAKEGASNLSLKQGDSWKTLTSEVYALPDTDLKRYLVVLEGLEEGKYYRFKLADENQVYIFRTPKKELKELKFAVGGDAYKYLSLFRRLTEEVAKKDPEFVVIGGDLAYTKGGIRLFRNKSWESRRWHTFLKECSSLLRGKDGRLIPILIVVGNHDIKDPAIDPYFNLFYYPKKLLAYTRYDFGSYLTLFTLDTGHASPIEGEQTLWLQKELQRSKNISYKIMCYHIAAYPSVYPFEGVKPTEIRKNWVPLFEEGQVQVCFENHNHAYKRTYALKKDKIDPKGIVYMGDGNWGVDSREPKKRWYLASSSSSNCFTLVTLSSDKAVLESFNIEGESIDSSPILPAKAS